MIFELPKVNFRFLENSQSSKIEHYYARGFRSRVEEFRPGFVGAPRPDFLLVHCDLHFRKKSPTISLIEFKFGKDFRSFFFAKAYKISAEIIMFGFRTSAFFFKSKVDLGELEDQFS